MAKLTGRTIRALAHTDPAWVPASSAETTRIINARRTEAMYGTLPVDSAVELTKAYQGFKRGGQP